MCRRLSSRPRPARLRSSVTVKYIENWIDVKMTVRIKIVLCYAMLESVAYTKRMTQPQPQPQSARSRIKLYHSISSLLDFNLHFNKYKIKLRTFVVQFLSLELTTRLIGYNRYSNQFARICYAKVERTGSERKLLMDSYMLKGST